MSRETTGRGKAAVPEVASREMEIQDMAPIFSLGEQLFNIRQVAKPLPYMG
jgi:hypothetical protein